MSVQTTQNFQPAPGTQAAAFEMLMNAIGSSLSPVIQQLLNSDPSLAQFKGWHGMTPLHRACLIGDYNIILMLIQANSDVNALTDFNESALHYASKRGLPPVVHLLIQCGARLDATDNNGRTAVHHAAENGAVLVMKYFEETFGADTRQLDNKLQSPMHLACEHGHLDLFKFLMQKGRSDLRQADSNGNLPIHLSAKQGFGHMTWFQLCILGVSILKQKNKEGFTPLDLVLQGDKPGHQELAPVLRYYSNQSDNFPVRGSLYKWYGQLLFPGLFYLILVIISQHLMEHQYLVFLLGAIGVGIQLRDVSHRMEDVSRWPNPIFAGFFGGGIIHTIICYFWLFYPNIYSRWWVTPATIAILPPMMFVYAKLIIQDPGRVRSSAQDPQTGKTLTLVDLCMMRDPPYTYCFTCDLVTNQLSKHCRLCEQCYQALDHHCLFLLKCVACNNHALFVWLLILVTFNMLMYLLAFVLYVLAIYPDEALTGLIWNLIHLHAWPSTLLLLNLGSAVWSVNLLLYQFSVISKGCTTYFNDREALRHPLSQQQAISNFLHFLAGRPLPYRVPQSPLQTVAQPTAAKVRDIPKHLQVVSHTEMVDVV